MIFVVYLGQDGEGAENYPPPGREAKMAEKTEAQKRAQKAYMEKFVRVQVRLEPDRYEGVKAHAEAHGQSVNGFINEAIDEKMERDKTEAG